MFNLGTRAAQDDESALHTLGDFTANGRLLLLSLVAIPIRIISAYVAVGLLSLINFFTNLFFFQRFSLAAASPAAHMLGGVVVIVPIIGGLVIGLMARYGSERIRGHGIPEAIESILIHGSRVEPKLAVLEPLPSAISIGSGGPFGAEGPQQRHQHVQVVRQLDREHDAPQRRAHRAAEDGAHADERPEARSQGRQERAFDAAERPAHHQQRRQHAARRARAERNRPWSRSPSRTRSGVD